MDTGKAAALYTELWEHLKSLHDDSLSIQTNNAREAVRSLAAASSEGEKEEIIRTYYKILYPGGRGGLSDVVLWSEDIETRIALNEPLYRIEKELCALIASSAEAPVSDPVPSADRPEEDAGQGGNDERNTGSPEPQEGFPKERGPRKGEKARKRPFSFALWIMAALLFVLSAPFSVEGRYVLFGIAVSGLAALLAGFLMLRSSHCAQQQNRTGAMILILITGLLLLGFGAVSELHVAKDMLTGTRTAVLNSCHISTRFGAHGILGLRYCIKGTDPQGREMQFPVSAGTKRVLEGAASVSVEYYPNTGRIVTYLSEEEPAPEQPVSFGGPERSRRSGAMGSGSESGKILSESCVNTRGKIPAVGREREARGLDKTRKHIPHYRDHAAHVRHGMGVPDDLR